MITNIKSMTIESFRDLLKKLPPLYVEKNERFTTTRYHNLSVSEHTNLTNEMIMKGASPMREFTIALNGAPCVLKFGNVLTKNSCVEGAQLVYNKSKCTHVDVRWLAHTAHFILKGSLTHQETLHQDNFFETEVDENSITYTVTVPTNSSMEYWLTSCLSAYANRYAFNEDEQHFIDHYRMVAVELMMLLKELPESHYKEELQEIYNQLCEIFSPSEQKKDEQDANDSK